MSLILALDQGTTSCRAMLFDAAGRIVGRAQRELTQHYPQPGWVEHDPEEIWQTQLGVARQVLAEQAVTAADVAAIGITNQRETTLLWDRRSGEPVSRAIVWQDRRTADYCDALRERGCEPLVRERTGLLIDPYFCGTKLRWLLDRIPGARRRAERGELAFGTVDSWLLWKLSGGRLHICDESNAARTLLFDIHRGCWDAELLELLEIPETVLPEVRPSSQLYGETDAELFGGPIRLAAAAGDQQSALFGQNCTRPGMAKNTYGTGCFVLMHIGAEVQPRRSRLLTTLACTSGERREYALEGSVFVAGAVVQWLRDGLGIVASADEIEPLARSVEDSDGVYLVPAFAGLGAPHWDAYARGTIVGLTRGTTRAHVARAALEGIAFQVADVLDAMHEDAGMRLDELRVDGGAAANDLLLQFQSDLLGVPVVRPAVLETTARGAAYLAGLAVGYWPDTAALEGLWQADRRFEPRMAVAESQRRRERWSEALRRARDWEPHG
jgi:glycerol kinase